jgi:hypothetical protein
VVLSLVAYRFSDAMSAENRAGARTTDEAQAKLAATSGLHYAAALLSDRAAFAEQLQGEPFDNADMFQKVEVAGAAGKKGYFDVVAVGRGDDGSLAARFGVTDEGGKLNLNALMSFDAGDGSTPNAGGKVLVAALSKLPNMTPDIANAIADWLDGDDVPREGGAESEAYQGLGSPYKAKNGPLNSLDELLLVQGVTPQLLYGDDTNRNGKIDGNEQGSDLGWAEFLTVYGRELNVDSTGTVRIYLNGDDLTVIQQQLVNALGEELAYYVLAAKLFAVTQTDASGSLPGATGATSGTATASVSPNGSATVTMRVAVSTQSGGNSNQRPTRAASLDELKAAVDAKKAVTFTGGNRVRSQFDLLNSRITLPRQPGAPPEEPDVIAFSPMLDPARRAALLATLLDKTTTRQAVEMTPRINVNTAPREVLLGLTGLTSRQGAPLLSEADVDAIVAARANLVPTDPGTLTAAWLVTGANLSTATMKNIERYVTGTSMVYRVQSVGYVDGTGGPVARMEAVIDTNQGAPRFLFVRDLSDLDGPRGFDPTARE